jgi:hypothetical protein
MKGWDKTKIRPGFSSVDMIQRIDVSKLTLYYLNGLLQVINSQRACILSLFTLKAKI